MSSSRLPFLFTDFEHIKYGMAFHALCRCHTVRCKCDQLFFTGCTISLHFPSTFWLGEILSKEFCHFQFGERIKSYLYFISVLFVEMRFFFLLAFLFAYIKNVKLFLFFFFFLSFHITNVGKCNQIVKYSNKRGIINTRRCLCALRVY